MAARPLRQGEGDMGVKAFGAIDGAEAYEILIASKAGASAKILTWGAVIRDLVVPTARERRA